MKYQNIEDASSKICGWTERVFGRLGECFVYSLSFLLYIFTLLCISALTTDLIKNFILDYLPVRNGWHLGKTGRLYTQIFGFVLLSIACAIFVTMRNRGYKNTAKVFAVLSVVAASFILIGLPVLFR